jgi:hypothetical protein
MSHQANSEEVRAAESPFGYDSIVDSSQFGHALAFPNSGSLWPGEYLPSNCLSIGEFWKGTFSRFAARLVFLLLSGSSCRVRIYDIGGALLAEEQ